MRHIEKNRAELFVFDSQADIDRFIDPDAYKHRDSSWVGEDLDKWADVQERMKQCWADGISILDMSVDRLKNLDIPELKDRRRKMHMSEDDGDDVDLEKLQQGEKAFVKHEREVQSVKALDVTIITDTSTPYIHDTEDILWRGAAAIALCHILEEKGYKAELWVVNGTELYDGIGMPVYTACCLKRPQDPLDTSTLVNVVAGWFYRTVTFALLDTICKTQGQGVAWGYGPCRSPRAVDLDQISTDPNRIYSTGVFSFSGACQQIEAEVQRLKEENE